MKHLPKLKPRRKQKPIDSDDFNAFMDLCDSVDTDTDIDIERKNARYSDPVYPKRTKVRILDKPSIRYDWQGREGFIQFIIYQDHNGMTHVPHYGVSLVPTTTGPGAYVEQYFWPEEIMLAPKNVIEGETVEVKLIEQGGT